jgi:hypothetical protein
LLPFKENEMTTKKQLTPEQRAMLNADATQRTTDVTARAAGTAQVCAIPAAKQAWTGFTGLFAKKTAATPVSL